MSPVTDIGHPAQAIFCCKRSILIGVIDNDLVPGVNDSPEQYAGPGGYPNLVAFAFGLDKNFAGGALRHDDLTFTARGGPDLFIDNQAFWVDFRVVFLRRFDYATLGLNYEVEFSYDLVNWYLGTNPIEAQSHDKEVDLVTMDYPLFLPDGTKARFFRMVVTH